MREALLRCLLEAARQDERMVLLSGDHGYALFDEFRRALPDQFLNCGIAEQNMVGVAAGMAKAGLRPIVYGLASFIPMRVLEQIKLDICYENRQVMFLGDGAGLVYAHLGVSHQCCEDVAALRALQGMTIYSAADRHEMKACARLALESEGPVYMRIGKCDLGELHPGPITLSSGGLLELRHGTGAIAWLATGSMVSTALKVARRWPRSAVWSVPCLKPVDEEQVRAICRQHKVVITIEEHALEGGLGSLICEVAAETAEARICRIGVTNPFFKRCGKHEYLIRQHGLSPDGIAAKVTQFMDTDPASFRLRAA